MLAKQLLGPAGHSRTQQWANLGLRAGLAGVGVEASKSGGSGFPAGLEPPHLLAFHSLLTVPCSLWSTYCVLGAVT